MKANVILPFDSTSRQTILPELGEGETMDMWHLTPEQGETVIAQVRGTEARIAAMKLAPAYCWLEDVEVPDAEI